jgi:hypothetical protein
MQPLSPLLIGVSVADESSIFEIRHCGLPDWCRNSKLSLK